MGNSAEPARQLRKELRRLRLATGLTQAQVAVYVGTAETTISKVETGDRLPLESHLKLMILCFSVDEEHAAALMELWRQAREPGWWQQFPSVSKWFTDFLRLESAASGVRTYESEYVPGLLQTPRYIDAITAAEPSENREVIATLRVKRQERLMHRLTLETVLNEAVLWRVVGSAEVMQEQLRFLRTVAENPNVTLRVLPFSAGAHSAMTGPFTILRYPGDLTDIVFIEMRGDAEFRDRMEEVSEYTGIFERISEQALNEEDTISLISSAERKHQ